MIPNIIHFVFGLAPDFGGKPFSLMHYLAIKSALEVNKPEKIFFHYEYEPAGEWWEKAKPLLFLNKLTAPDEIYGNPLFHYAHKGDVINLRVLQQWGGIYLDIDTICVKPYKHLLINKAVLGLEHRKPVFYNEKNRIRYAIKRLTLFPFKRLPAPGIKGLGNAVILAEPQSEFINLWLNSYRTFRSKKLFDEYWNEHSVRIPFELAKNNSHLVTILSVHHFFFPYYDEKGLALMFEKVHSFPEAIVHHLWESLSWDSYVSNLTPEEVLTRDTTYNLIARKYL